MSPGITPPEHLEVMVSTDERGEFLAAYVQIRDGEVDRTVEVADGKVLLDLDANGVLLGFEILERCNGTLVEQVALQHHVRRPQRIVNHPSLARILRPIAAG